MGEGAATHIVIDIETLSTQQNAAIWQIGAVAFEEGEGVIDGFFSDISVDQYDRPMLKDFDVSISTSLWIATELEPVHQPKFSGADSLYDALYGFRRWCSEMKGNDEVLFWGNGPHFDLGILEHAFDRFGLTYPWEYNESRCIRTACDLMGVRWKDHFRDGGVAHNALDDARAEASGLMEALAKASAARRRDFMSAE